jgi:hypothetical protein
MAERHAFKGPKRNTFVGTLKIEKT